MSSTLSVMRKHVIVRDDVFVRFTTLNFGSIKELKFVFDFEATKFSNTWKILPHCKCQYTRFFDKIKQQVKQTE